MRASWLGFFVFVWILGAFLGSTFEYHTTSTWSGNTTGGYSQSPVSTAEYLLNVNNVIQRSEVLGTFPVITPNPDYFKAAFKVVLWQFSFFYDTSGEFAYGLVYYIFFLPFAIIGALSLVLLVYGILSGNLTFS